MRSSYPSGLIGKEDPDLLIQLPGKTVFRIFHLKAQSGQVIADFITGSPILIGFGYHTLFQKHIHHFAESFFTSASASRLFFQTENVESTYAISTLPPAVGVIRFRLAMPSIRRANPFSLACKASLLKSTVLR